MNQSSASGPSGQTFIPDGWDENDQPRPLIEVDLLRLPAEGSSNRIGVVRRRDTGEEMPCVMYAITIADHAAVAGPGDHQVAVTEAEATAAVEYCRNLDDLLAWVADHQWPDAGAARTRLKGNIGMLRHWNYRVAVGEWREARPGPSAWRTAFRMAGAGRGLAEWIGLPKDGPCQVMDGVAS